MAGPEQAAYRVAGSEVAGPEASGRDQPVRRRLAGGGRPCFLKGSGLAYGRSMMGT
ncbi:hypothetical protein RCH07_002073 [Arthrobacter sp. CG_A4]|nr:hypothetical protein [Arthrobacter sp. CG_A4]